jgi:hypothetical protein
METQTKTTKGKYKPIKFMKSTNQLKIFRLLGLLLLFPISCFGQAFIKGTISNLQNDSITFFYEKNYIALEKEKLKIQLIQNSFTITLPIHVGGKVMLEYIGNDKQKQIVNFYAQPKDSVKISFDANGAFNTMTFEGNNFLYNRHWYLREQYLQKSYIASIKKRNPEEYLKYMDSLSFREIKIFDEFIETMTKKNKKIMPSDDAMFHSWSSKIYRNEILKMQYPEQKYLLQGITPPSSYYNFLKKFGFQHDKAIVSEEYRNFLEIYMMFVYQNKYGVATIEDMKSYKQLFDMIATVFKGELTRSFLQARVIARVALYFPEEAKPLYEKYLKQNPKSIFTKDLEAIVK